MTRQTISPRDGDERGAPDRLRVVIVDDHPIVRKGLSELINHEPGMTVCGEADTADGGLACIRLERPDVAVIDLTLGLDSGLELVKALNHAMSETRVLVLSMHDESLHAERALAAGAHGYVMKDQAMGRLLGAIRCVASGQVYVSPEVAERIVARVRKPSRTVEGSRPAERLTDREREVFALIGRGLSTRAIAEHLDLSVKTIETYQSRIKEKFGLNDSHQLIRAAVEWAQS
ncbi:MAG TPA: response regulator transcription factor [Thermoleophilia bacterium]|nr:response regulator transcription factor [Thermoleophilia bacterium]